MRQAAADLEFEEAAQLRDELRRLEQVDLGLAEGRPMGPRRLAARIRSAEARTNSKSKARSGRGTGGAGRSRKPGKGAS